MYEHVDEVIAKQEMGWDKQLKANQMMGHGPSGQ